MPCFLDFFVVIFTVPSSNISNQQLLLVEPVKPTHALSVSQWASVSTVFSYVIK